MHLCASWKPLVTVQSLRPPRSHRVRDELGGGGQLVVLLAPHLHHVAALALEEAQQRVGTLPPPLPLPDADAVVHEVQPRPGGLARVGAEHGVRAEDVHLQGAAR